ncbi:hypothetical protein LWI29_028234 [Acer saccharum]|uniref:Uncharacterized protein n=1 Tax=Acer saccharum TaxID=4024 RepID=A0AA39VGT8_ACESA|nr:hypothetical protein LWI29_028234 [Acer saccharum]
MVIYTLFVLFGQAAATLFGRLYYERGGKSICMATFAQLTGFPLLFPFYCISPPRNPTTISIHSEQQSSIILSLAYISVLGMPIVPILAVIFSHDKMNGIKIIAMVLVMWGFVSYIYQYYLDNLKSESEKTNVCEISKLSRLEEDG